jgi:hypothetical protein
MTRRLVLEPTATAQWHALVSEAEAACQHRLDPALESYLVFLLMRFVEKPELAGGALALDYLRGMESAGGVRRDRLRAVGDQCLLYAGLFPQRAERRLVRISYFVALGRTAYQAVAESVRHQGAEVYAQLSDDFTSLRDVLQATRELQGEPSLTGLQAAELWADTASRRAYQTLRRITDATPARDLTERRH